MHTYIHDTTRRLNLNCKLHITVLNSISVGIMSCASVSPYHLLEPFNTPNDETEFTYPIGAPISLLFTHTDDPLDGSGDLTIGFTFLPDSHTPLQQPHVGITLDSQGISARVEYSSASPSLTGDYVLCCRQIDQPQLCGGRISLTVTGEPICEL